MPRVIESLLLIACSVSIPLVSAADSPVLVVATGEPKLATIAAAANGSFVVIWDTFWQVRGQRFSSTGATVGDEFRVDLGKGTGETGMQADVAMNASGAFVVAWSALRGSALHGAIYAHRFGADGVALGDDFAVGGPLSNDRLDAAVAMNDSGAFVVAWDDPAGVHAQAFDSRGALHGGQVSNTKLQATQVDVAMNRDGGFVLAWHAGSDNDSDVFAQCFGADGTSVADAFRVNEFVAGRQLEPSVAVDGAGRFVIGWISDQVKPSQPVPSYMSPYLVPAVFARRFGAEGGPLGGEFQVSGPLSFNVGVDANASGGFVVAWGTRSNGLSFESDLRARRYDASGIALGSDLVFTHAVTLPAQEIPVALDDVGGIAAAWPNLGSEPSIHARRFEGPGGSP